MLDTTLFNSVRQSQSKPGITLRRTISPQSLLTGGVRRHPATGHSTGFAERQKTAKKGALHALLPPPPPPH